ncbi:subtilisin inhibitor-like [Amycolatopsis cihanbeyliensis]|uniref:Subtilisin inhibitor-like n=2 Tax=Amycolatopsis cihanbeyliensis TaxID=1128664 RepID=A0A542DKE2_AMYCI|nr:subtilisin inhibitor-like [Amycolatopsis cihanbeyliensis]
MLHKRFLSLAPAILAVMATIVAGTAPAAASQHDLPGDESKGVLILTISEGERARPDAAGAVLTCEPAGGTHPLSEAACAELAAVNGEVAAVELEPQRPCYLIYRPLTVTAHGSWDGRPISYRETFPNDCVLDVIKGPIFRF